MALQKQVIVVPFGYGGIDQKTDSKILPTVKLSDATDIRFNKIGRIDRRLGQEPLYNSAATFSHTVVRLLANDDQLIAINGGHTSAMPMAWQVEPNGMAQSRHVSGTSVTIVSSNYVPAAEIIAEDTAASAVIDATYTASSRADGTTHYCIASYNKATVFRKDTGQVVRESFVPGNPIQVVSHPLGGDQFVVAWSSATNHQWATFSDTTDMTSPVISETATGSFTALMAGAWDMCTIADGSESTSAKVFFAYSKLGAGLRLRQISWPTTAGSIVNNTVTTILNGAKTVGAVVAFASHHNNALTTANIRPIWSEFGGASITGIRTATYSHTLSQVLAQFDVSTSLTLVGGFTGVQLGDGTSQVFIMSTTNSTDEPFVEAYGLNAANNSTSILWRHRRMGLLSKAASEPNGNVAYVYGGYSVTSQPTRFLIGSATDPINSASSNVRVMGRIFHCSSLTNETNSGLIPFLNYSATGLEFITTGHSRQSVSQVFSGSNNVSRYKMASIKFSLAAGRGWYSAKSRNDLLITGGYLARMNGAEGPIPNGPLIFPTIVSASSTTGGNMTVGSYQVSGIFEFADATGRVHRSAPATPSTVVLSGTNTAIALTAANYTLADGLSGLVRFIPFRTLVNTGAVYYRCGSVSTTSTLDNLSVNLTDSDTVAAAAEPLYTSGNVYENWQPSAPIAIASNARRTLVVPGDRPTFVAEGKATQDTTGVEFFEEVGKWVTPEGERIFALAAYRDKWFAFKKRLIFVAAGDGADNTGQNDTLSEFEPLTPGLGCEEPRSVVTTGAGVVFKSKKGWYIVGDDLQPTYIGAAVEDYASATVVDATFNKEKNEAHFILSSGFALVLTVFVTDQGYEFRWSRDTNCTGNSVAVVSGLRHIASSSVTTGAAYPIYPLYREASNYIDRNISSTEVPNMKVTTAWVPMANIQGFGRVYKALILGTFPSSQNSTTVSVEIGYDYESTWTLPMTIASANIEVDDPEISGTQAQFEVRPTRQVCEAIRFRITSGAPLDVSNGAQGLGLNQIQLVVGIKANENKMPATKRAT